MESASMETTETEAAAAAALPDDLLAGVLGLLPARSVAASRGVCKAWRDLIDERQLLLRFRSLLPHSVRGIFFNYGSCSRPHFFSRPTSSSSGRPRIRGKFDFIKVEYPRSWSQVVDHCNGLVLYSEGYGRVLHVCNPTTRWSARLPRWPGGGTCHYHYTTLVTARRAFLVFDPFVSPEYKVLLSPHPHEPGRRKQLKKDDACYLMEWPPSPWKSWYEFSSSTGRWEEKAFVREGEAAGIAGDLLRLNKIELGYPEPHWHFGAYWQGALYTHCRGEYVSRFSLLDDKYRVIKSPIQLADRENGVRSFVGRSEKGVYIAAIATVGLGKFRVWTLNESGDQMEWVPKDQSSLKINTHTWWMEKKKLDEMKYWILDLDNNGIKNQEVSLEQNICWNSDDDNNIDDSYDEKDEKEGWEYIKFLGFHPYKEVVFLSAYDYVVAFHLNSPKVQYLGSVDVLLAHSYCIRESFVYTPCLIGD